MTFIYLDDDEDDLELFKLAAESVENIQQIYTTTDFSVFFEMLERSPVNRTIVFLDINMPVKTGFIILKAIREKKEFDSVVVVMYSTSVDSTSVSISRDLGANYYSGKPDNLRNLQKIIMDVIARFEGPSGSSDFLIRV
ncbi:MAG: response regulator [Bacteroidetes bacterium]|jgi:DNA-binding response OmpR family regulator|nr:response regulator [Bacteroidota bacterium]